MYKEQLIDEIYRLEAEQRKVWYELKDIVTEEDYEETFDEFITCNRIG